MDDRSRSTAGISDASVVANLQLIVVVAMWLFVGAFAARKRIRQAPHRRWMTALETLREWDRTAQAAELRAP